MKDKVLNVGFADVPNRDVLVIRKTDSDGVVIPTSWDLEEIQKEGYMGVCEKIGNAVMHMLADSHKETLEKYPMLVPPKPLVSESWFMVNQLIQLSMKQKTKVYIGAIEKIFEQNPDDLKGTSMIEAWPVTKEIILRYPD